MFVAFRKLMADAGVPIQNGRCKLAVLDNADTGESGSLDCKNPTDLSDYETIILSAESLKVNVKDTSAKKAAGYGQELGAQGALMVARASKFYPQSAGEIAAAKAASDAEAKLPATPAKQPAKV